MHTKNCFNSKNCGGRFHYLKKEKKKKEKEKNNEGKRIQENPNSLVKNKDLKLSTLDLCAQTDP